VPGPIQLKTAIVLVFAVCLAFLSSACNQEKPMSETEKNLKALTVCYGRFISQNRGKGPPNEAEFKKFIRALPQETLGSVGVDSANVDKLFVSPRDNEPYGIAWNASGGAPGPGGAPMIIWEQTGVNGKRFVSDFLGKIEEIDEATFKQRLSNVKK
jgi:hypothetical protein